MVSPLGPEPSASANSATSAKRDHPFDFFKDDPGRRTPRFYWNGGGGAQYLRQDFALKGWFDQSMIRRNSEISMRCNAFAGLICRRVGRCSGLRTAVGGARP